MFALEVETLYDVSVIPGILSRVSTPINTVLQSAGSNIPLVNFQKQPTPRSLQILLTFGAQAGAGATGALGVSRRNWQGEVAGSGIPLHPTRQLLRYPALFEFDGPVIGTYPPWNDPSYWNEGLQWRFKLKPLVQMIASALLSEIRLLFRARPELVAGIIALALLSGPLGLAGLREFWPFLAMPMAVMAIYLPVQLLAAARFRPEVQETVASVALAVFLVMALGTADYTVRVATNHMAVPGTGPESAWQDVVAAEQLRRMGAQPGDNVAVIADGTGAYWARLAKLRIVAEITDANHGSKDFWDAPEPVRQQAYEAFARSHAKLVVTVCPPGPPGTHTGWEQVAETPYCARRLQ